MVRILLNGGFTFAEHPALEAPEARIIWRADLDPGTLIVVATRGCRGDPDSLEYARLAPWLTVVADAAGEHAVISDGWHHLRLDVIEGSIAGVDPVVLHYRLKGVVSAEPGILSLRRLVDLARHRRFARSLYPVDRKVGRWLTALQVHDALAAGASHRDIAATLFGEDRTAADFDRRADSLRSRVRRLVREARSLAAGGYRSLIARGATSLSR